MAENKERKRSRDRVRRALKKKAGKGKEFKIMRGSSGDLVAIQIAAIVEKLPKGFKLTREFVEEAIRYKADTSEGYWDGVRVAGAVEGENPPGIRLVILRWKNPDRDISSDQSWRYASPDSPSDQADAWGSLRRIIAKASLSVRISRNR